MLHAVQLCARIFGTVCLNVCTLGLYLHLAVACPTKTDLGNDSVLWDENEFIRETERRFQTMYSYMRNNSEAGFKRNAKLYSGSSEEFNECCCVCFFLKFPSCVVCVWEIANGCIETQSYLGRASHS